MSSAVRTLDPAPCPMVACPMAAQPRLPRHTQTALRLSAQPLWPPADVRTVFDGNVDRLATADLREGLQGLDLAATVAVELADLVLRGVVACPMCSHGRRESIVDEQVSCPWCGARGVLPLNRALALHAQLKTKTEREQTPERRVA